MEELGRADGCSEIVIRHAVSLLRLEGLVETTLEQLSVNYLPLDLSAG